MSDPRSTTYRMVYLHLHEARAMTESEREKREWAGPWGPIGTLTVPHCLDKSRQQGRFDRQLKLFFLAPPIDETALFYAMLLS